MSEKNGCYGDKNVMMRPRYGTDNAARGVWFLLWLRDFAKQQIQNPLQKDRSITERKCFNSMGAT